MRKSYDACGHLASERPIGPPASHRRRCRSCCSREFPKERLRRIDHIMGCPYCLPEFELLVRWPRQSRSVPFSG